MKDLCNLMPLTLACWDTVQRPDVSGGHVWWRAELTKIKPLTTNYYKNYCPDT